MWMGSNPDVRPRNGVSTWFPSRRCTLASVKSEIRPLAPPLTSLVRTSKFDAPRPRAGAIERERLLCQLAAAADSPLVLVSASAGYGKSTLAAQWSVRCQRPVTWINLDRSDDDPSTFLDTLSHALGRLDPTDTELLDEFTPSDPGRLDLALAVELDRLTPFQLIIDDADALTQSTSLAVLGFLLDGIRPGSQVMLLTRVEMDLPLARRRLAGDLFEIRADELSLDADETRALAVRSGTHLSEQALTILSERTEGWPAGIALALHALDETVSADDVARTITGDQLEIADYLVEVILSRETQQRRRFLLATSVLERMTAPLCDAVLDVTGSSATLAELERSNSFVIALDDHRGWYRYHHLFGELLRSELDRTDPELATICLARAAQWHQRDGSDPSEGFRCAHACGDLELAGKIALASADGFARRARLDKVRRWVLDCTDEEISSDPQLALASAWVHGLSGEPEQAQRFAAAAEKTDFNLVSADGATSFRSSLASLRTVLASSGIHEMLADAEFVCAAAGEASTRWLFGGFVAAGIANLLLDRPDEAAQGFREALTLTSGRPELVHVKVVCLGYLAFALAELGNAGAAQKAALEARALSAEQRLEPTMPGGVAFVARAMVLAHEGNFDRSALELSNARSISHLFRGARWLNADMNIRLGNISVDLGDCPAAQVHADTARAALHGYPDPGTLVWRLAELDRRIFRISDLLLTPAEIRILPFLPTHLSIKEIAESLHVSPATVKTHVSSVYAKLNAPTRSDAVERMERLGLLPRRRAARVLAQL